MTFYYEGEARVEVEFQPEDIGLHTAGDWLEAADLDIDDVVEYYGDELREAVNLDLDSILERYADEILGSLTLDTIRRWLARNQDVNDMAAVAGFARARENEIRQDQLSLCKVALEGAQREIEELTAQLNADREPLL